MPFVRTPTCWPSYDRDVKFALQWWGCSKYALFVKAGSVFHSKMALWRRRSDKVLTSDVVASRAPGPPPPPEWAAALRQLTELSRTPTLAPSWWTPRTAFFGNIETRTDPQSYHWDGMKRLGRRDPPLFFFQLTMAGWGHFQLYGQAPRRVSPGTGFFAIIPRGIATTSRRIRRAGPSAGSASITPICWPGCPNRSRRPARWSRCPRMEH